MPKSSNPNLLVGFSKADDAGVFQIDDKRAIVQTVDFFPPIVDDPYYFGQIAAANALSDIYAMGGTPLTALNIVGFPPKMNPKILTEILRGGSDKIDEANAVTVGGHSIKDGELKYGVSCTGIVDIDKIVKNDNAQPGDRLFLTKPLGTGIITTAIKKGMASKEDADEVVRVMAELNRKAAELMVRNGAHAATDITGYGLLGHTFEIAEASGASIRIDFNSLPLLNNVLQYAKDGALTGGANANRDYIEKKVQLSEKLTKPETDLLFDAQTSGGLLIAMPEKSAGAFIKDAENSGLSVFEIGLVVEKDTFAITIE